MKLYISPGSCSLTAQIALLESGLQATLVRVDIRTHQLEDGTDYYRINPSGMVPMLELEGGAHIGEVSAVLQYIADQVPEKRLAPPNGTLARYRLQEALSFIAAEIHKNNGVLFNPIVDAGAKAYFRQRIRRKYDVMDRQLASTGWLVGDHFTVADAYLYVMTRAVPLLSVDLEGLEALARFVQRVEERPTVQRALHTEAYSTSESPVGAVVSGSNTSLL